MQTAATTANVQPGAARPVATGGAAIGANTFAGYQIIRRNGAVVPFEPNKIAIAMMKAFLAVQKEFGTFDAFIWQFVGGAPIVNRLKRAEGHLRRLRPAAQRT